MSESWLGALRTKMGSNLLERDERHWAPACAGATRGDVGRVEKARLVEASSERDSSAPRSKAGETAR